MPGLGDTRLGDRERMIKALGEDADFILFVRKPNKDGDKWGEDVTLRDSAHQALQDKLPLEKWSFMVLNHDGGNHDMCKTMKATGAKEGIDVAQYIIANCSNSEEANQKILTKVYLYLLDPNHGIIELDKKYLTSWQQSLEKLQLEVKNILNEVRKAIKKSGKAHAEYVDLFKEFWQKLSIKLEELRLEILKPSIEQDPQFKKQIDIAIEKCRSDKDNDFPSVEYIRNCYYNKASIGGTYDQCMHEIRANTLKHFHGIEIGLKKSLDEKKGKVTEILRQLNIINLISNDDNIAFLQQLSEEIPSELSNPKRGFEFISNFDLLYKGFIQSIIWQHLSKFLPTNGDPLAVTAMVVVQKLQDTMSDFSSDIDLGQVTTTIASQSFQSMLGNSQSGIDLASVAAIAAGQSFQDILNNLPSSIELTQLTATSNGFNPKVMQNILKERYAQAIDKCEQALNVLAYSPADIGRSMIEEFIDHVLRAKNVEDEWNKFLGDEAIRVRVWPKLGEIEERKETQIFLLNLVDEAESVNRSLSVLYDVIKKRFNNI